MNYFISFIQLTQDLLNDDTTSLFMLVHLNRVLTIYKSDFSFPIIKFPSAENNSKWNFSEI